MWIITMMGGGSYESKDGQTLKQFLQHIAERVAEDGERCSLIKHVDYDGKLITRSFPQIEFKAQLYLERILSDELQEMAAENAHRQSLTRYYEGTRF